MKEGEGRRVGGERTASIISIKAQKKYRRGFIKYEHKKRKILSKNKYEQAFTVSSICIPLQKRFKT